MGRIPRTSLDALDGNVPEPNQQLRGTDIQETVLNAYIITGSADTSDTPRQPMGGEDELSRETIDTMIAARSTRLPTDRSTAGSKPLQVPFKEAASVKQ